MKKDTKVASAITPGDGVALDLETVPAYPDQPDNLVPVFSVARSGAGSCFGTVRVVKASGVTVDVTIDLGGKPVHCVLTLPQDQALLGHRPTSRTEPSPIVTVGSSEDDEAV